MCPRKYILQPPEELNPYVPINNNIGTEKDNKNNNLLSLNSNKGLNDYNNNININKNNIPQFNHNKDDNFSNTSSLNLNSKNTPDNGSNFWNRNSINNKTTTDTTSQDNNAFPDFKPWKHEPQEDEIFTNFLSKGYYVSSKVNFESISARSSLNESLPKLSNQLSDQFSRILQIRENSINRIPSNINVTLNNHKSSHSSFSINSLAGPEFILPHRVTLTDNKKEQWLQDLSSPYASIAKITEFIPHGLKRRQVIEQCYLKQIPLKRATWFIKCCYSIELQSLHLKNQHSKVKNLNELDSLYRDWTDTFVYILEKLIFEMKQYYNDTNKLKIWKLEISYFLKLLGNCYSLNMLHNEFFFHWLVEFVSKIENFEFLPICLHILTIFTDDIINLNTDSNYQDGNMFLISKITDILLNKYHAIYNSKSMINDEKYIINDIKKNNKIKENLLNIISNIICKLFQEQSLEIFIFPPSSWEIYKPCLFEITSKITINKNEIKKKLELISYRNDTMKNNSLLIKSDELNNGHTNNRNSNDDNYQTTNSMDLETENKSILSSIFTKTTNGITHFNITNIDIKFIKLLDENKTDFDWSQFFEQNSLKLSQIVQLIIWSIHPSRQSHYESNQLVVKLLLLQINSTGGTLEYKIEDTIWSLIFQLGKLSDKDLKQFVDLFTLYQLLNILNTYGMIKVPTYIRKLISSGIMYLHDSNYKFFHIKLLINLKISPVMKSQYNMILRNIMDYAPQYYELYNFDQLTRLVETNRERCLNPEKNEKLEHLPLSAKIMLGEWYLNQLCFNRVLESVDRETLINNYKIFCIDLQVSQLFYKWIEFIVYHQLLANVETMETLVNILLRYQMLFSQFINDHILFTKTFIYLYQNVLRNKDPFSYQLISLMPFWKFFMKNFPMALTIDNNLRNELQNVYEEEKNKLELLTKDHEYAKSLYISNNEEKRHLKINNMTNFAEIFQTNMKIVLPANNIHSNDEKIKARNNLLLIMETNTRDYSKYMSIFLKRKHLDNIALITLIAEKLLTLDHVKRTIGMFKVLELISYQYESREKYIYFDTHKKEYIRNKYELVISSCLEDVDKYYKLALNILIEVGPISKYSTVTSKLIKMFLDNNCSNVIIDLLFFGSKFVNNNEIDEGGNESLNDTESDNEFDKLFSDDNDLQKIQDEENLTQGNRIYCLLDFTNMWIFQNYTNYNISVIYERGQTEFTSKFKQFIFEIMKITQYDELCSHLFDSIDDINIIKLIIDSMQIDFFEKCLSKLNSNDDAGTNDLNAMASGPKYLNIIIQLIISISNKIHNITKKPMEICLESFKLLQEIIQVINVKMNKCLQEKTNFVNKLDEMLDIIFKIITIEQDSIFQIIIDNIMDSAIIEFINNVSQIFDKITTNLQLKLTIYEILTSLRSFCLYINNSICDNHSYKIQQLQKNKKLTEDKKLYNNDDNLNNGGDKNSTNHKRVTIPSVLLNLPPFEVSSFVKNDPNEFQGDLILQNVKKLNGDDSKRKNRQQKDNKMTKDNKKWFVYDARQKNYVCLLNINSFQNVTNHQRQHDSKLNDSCYNLSLFNASLDNKNPS